MSCPSGATLKANFVEVTLDALRNTFQLDPCKAKRAFGLMDDLLPDPSTLTMDDLDAIGVGLSSIVVHIRGTNLVVKTFPPLDKDQISERRIYEHLQNSGQGHPNILRYFGRSPPEYELLRGGLFLEYHPRGTLAACLGKLDAIGVPETEKLSWPYQAVSAVDYIHSRGVVHGDIGLHNFLVHDDGRLVLCDFAGSGMEGLNPTIGAGVRYANPQYDENPYSTAEDDIFALGTVLYELGSAKRLFEGQSSRDNYRHLRDREFPDLSMVPLPLRDIIDKCWNLPSYKASDALAELETQPPSAPKLSLPGLRPTLIAALISSLAVAWVIFGDVLEPGLKLLPTGRIYVQSNLSLPSHVEIMSNTAANSGLESDTENPSNGG